MSIRLRQRPAHGRGRRLLDWFRVNVLGSAGKSQRVSFVDINGFRYKRIAFGDSHRAAEVLRGLLACKPVVGLPDLLLHHENELWVDFVEGRQPRAELASDRLALVGFFAALHALPSEQLDLAALNLHQTLLGDLRFLQRCGVLDPTRHAALVERAEQFKPERIWVGADYLDPVLKNFVINENGLAAIDIESFDLRSPLGTGLAKSRLHWLEPYRNEFIDAVLAQPGVPDFRAQLPYVGLCFLAGWSKRKMLTGKVGRVRAERFDPFLTGSRESGAQTAETPP